MSARPGFVSEVVIAAPPHDVFSAVSSLEGLAGWWVPTVTGCTAQGGEVVFSFGDQRIIMRVDHVDDPRQVTWTCLRHTKFPEWDGTTVRFDLRTADEDADATVLSFEHAGLVPEFECFSMCSSGWGHYLASLADHLVKGEGTPWTSSP
ncbi:MAG TPA: SRPBCC domain-containing protein [Acidimicrobiales bacterium]|nr:SRPBCC domain-containing protein [Acidimicrobiales bacterium]